ncbi:dihydroorotase [Aspergillus thermomutatus]|uniref:dihydroorotase n=1 Tax=Aspergillus thermomutatus TaxID=41047 RepID=A0A397HJQ0_ASPTH|nr:uncharacterized protein CDV56_107504 [Aspergillus thermomutatus]RHZ61453.1 hypothetical protein CDV56_107504 [Aspergillus thermomutatus]
MILKETTRLELPAAADMHVHLRQGKMMELVVPQIRKGGVDTVFVMPNLVPPITSVAQALEYKAQLQAIEPKMPLLTVPHQSVTPETIREAAAAGITGVKVYPQGVTTNSAAGVRDYDEFFPVFAEMEKHDMVLNLHGEVPGSPGSDINDMNAEEKFLPTLKMLNDKFPDLRIILEHCSTEAALEAVRSCSASVAATITAHHLYLTHHSCENPLAFCKPLPKTSKDRDALIRAVCSGDPKFFFGSDSAPHPRVAKQGGAEGTAKPPAGVFTQPCVVQYVLLALEEGVERGVIADEDITQAKLENFLSVYGRKFYKLPEAKERIVLERKGDVIPESVKSEDGSVEVALSRGGDAVFSLTWKSS